jgi:hypothetical protein
MQAHVKALRFPVPNGEPCEDSESGSGVNMLGEVAYLCRVFRILASDRVDLGVGCSKVEVLFQERLDIGIGALEMEIKLVFSGV